MATARSCALVVIATTCMGCYDWVPTNVAYVRAHPYEEFRVTDSVGQTMVADHVVVEGNQMLLAPRPPAWCTVLENAVSRATCYASDLERRRAEIPRVDFVPYAPLLERRKLDGGLTAIAITVLGVATIAVGGVAFLCWSAANFLKGQF